MSTHVLKVDEQYHQFRLDIFLTQHLTDIPSRNFVQRLIANGQVTVNKKSVKAHQKVSTGDEIVVDVTDLPQDDQNIKAEKIPLDIFYEDDYILLINKPAGLLVHPVNASHTSGTLVNALLHHCEKLSTVNKQLRPGIVHRLDRETSGLILVAKDNRTHVKLAKQFETHQVKKRYAALVEGKVEYDEGLVDASIGRHPKYHDRKKISFDDDSKDAETMYRVIKRGSDRTLVALFPKTGRTHQLRVHMAHLGHPVLGDDKYGKRLSFPRLALHAQSIGFFHPKTNKFIEFSTALPEEFRI